MKLRVRPDHPDVDLFNPAGHPDSIPVKSGDEIEVPGEISKDSPEDAYLIGDRLWPKAVWELVENTPAKVKES
ncbi:MAG: hypothetical protein AUG44_08780 [Actinobacteria bacterium 13_1_20CM_3_71_11]|nr:MAG: hypothetical protein AUG44_08780 [Actinobacteria bacterium 13_1_20CM_3_71_11]